MANVEPRRGFRESDHTGPYLSDEFLGIRGPGIVYIKDKPRFVREALAKQAGGRMSKAAGKDGLARNIAKLHEEADKMIDAVKTENAKGTHDPVTNAFVEGARASPYAFGHIALFVVAILVVALAVAIIL